MPFYEFHDLYVFAILASENDADGKSAEILEDTLRGERS